MMPSYALPAVPFFFFFNDTATTEIYTLSLHDALPISWRTAARPGTTRRRAGPSAPPGDRKSTRLNSSHGSISYAVFCLKKKKTQQEASRLDKQKISNTQLDYITTGK